ncbi:MAG TPA: polymer-forming cytoskeletal protein [Terriglobales bacterium]|nr:polymer-forming cytoskeletal protein [Terriglobales bacterium]
MWKPAPVDGSNTGPAPQPSAAKPADNRSYTDFTPPKPVANTNHAVIGKSLVIKGEITGAESVLIEGQVEGSVRLPGNYVNIGASGKVKANITAAEVVVRGNLEGNVTVGDRLDIRTGGSLTGDVVAKRISIEEGAFFKGSIDMKGDGKPRQESKQESSSFKQESGSASSRSPKLEEFEAALSAD